MTESPIIVALDFASLSTALHLADQLDPDRCRVKVGKELFTREGPAVIHALHNRGFEVFLDLKFHDIPNTVAKACAAAADLGIWMLNVHTLGGSAMMNAARQAVGTATDAPLLIGVTLLTSMDQATFNEVGLSGDMPGTVQKLALLAKDSGLDGVVCSAQEASLLQKALGKEFCLVTPGIRPKDSVADDQHRTMTPIDAVQAGSHYLVIGRPITGALNPMQALAEIEASLG